MKKASAFVLTLTSLLFAGSVAMAQNPASGSDVEANGSSDNANTAVTGRSSANDKTKVNPLSGIPVGQPLQPNDLGYDASKPEPDNR